ncbi:MAG: MFS transporter, partial [Acidimicrobiales bacterium]|nr:MFS transporter [Acidimicrobiales bacterium]
NQTGQVITVFFMGLALAQIVYGPLADRFGRKPILYVGIGIYLLGAIGSALAPSFGWLLASRFVWGVGAAGSRVVATAIVRDRFVGNAMAKAMSQIMAVFVLVPVIAPSLGAVIIEVVPWRGVFWFCVVWAVLIGLWSLRLRETLNPAFVQPLNMTTTRRNYVAVLRTPVTSGYTLATVFLQGVFTTYLATSELIISDILGRGGQFPVVFGAVAVLFGLAALINGRFVERFGMDGMVTRALAVVLPLSVVLVVLAVLSDGRPNFWLFMPVLGLLLAGFMFLMPNLNTAAMVPVGEIAGSASALTGALRMAGGAVLASILGAWIDLSVTPFALGVCAFCLLAAATIGVVNHRATGSVMRSGISGF